MNGQISLASKKILFFLITLLYISVFFLCQLYDISFSAYIFTKNEYDHYSIKRSENNFRPKEDLILKNYIIHHHIHKSDENTSISDKLYKEVKVLCWIMTSPTNHKLKAEHVLKTWGKRCNKILFMSSRTDKILKSIPLPVQEGRDNLWSKTKEAFKYIYKHHFNEYDWFLKADDDTYVIVENLRYMLYRYDPKSPVYFGCRFNKYTKQGFMSGGAGYVLSKEAVRRFIEVGLKDPEKCRMETDGDEDVETGICLENVGVIAGDSRDDNKRGRFFPFAPADHLLANPSANFWYWEYIYYKTTEGLDCCSDYAISFHYIDPRDMYLLDYFIYHLRPFGIHKNKKLLIN